MMNLLGFIMSLVYMQAVHGWLSTYERLVNSQKFFSPYLTQEDLSRLGRNYIEVGKLTEEFFPLYDIRLVAVSDGVDSDEGEDDFTPFKNIMNEYYAKDISLAIRSASIALSKHSTCSSSESRNALSRERTVDMTEFMLCSAVVSAEPLNHLAL